MANIAFFVQRNVTRGRNNASVVKHVVVPKIQHRFVGNGRMLGERYTIEGVKRHCYNKTAKTGPALSQRAHHNVVTAWVGRWNMEDGNGDWMRRWWGRQEGRRSGEGKRQ